MKLEKEQNYTLELDSLDMKPECEKCYFYGKTTKRNMCGECFKKESNFCHKEQFYNLENLVDRLTEVIEDLEKDKAELLLANKLLEAEVDVAKGNVISGDEAMKQIKEELFGDNSIDESLYPKFADENDLLIPKDAIKLKGKIKRIEGEGVIQGKDVARGGGMSGIIKEPVKKARWEIDEDGYYPYCTNCNYEPYDEYKHGGELPEYCPKCGCKMEEIK